MAHGGSRPGAGRKPDPNSARQKRLAAKAAKAEQAAQAFAPAGVKTEGTPKTWPFGSQPVKDEPEAPPAADPDLSGLTPLDYLLQVVRDPSADQRVRIQAASIAAPFVHAKKGDGAGKKEAAAGAARAAAGGGRFSAAAPPKLAAVGGRKV